MAEHDGLLPVVAHLLDAEASTRLLRVQDGTASLLRGDGTLVEVVDAASFTTADLVAYLQAAVDGTLRRVVLVVLGGDEQHREAASNARPVFGSGRIDVCGIDESGTLWWDAQTKAKSPTVQALGTFDPLRAAPVERAEIIARLQPLEASPSDRDRELPPDRRGGIRATFAVVTVCVGLAVLDALWTLLPTVPPASSAFAEPWRLLSTGWLHLGGAHVSGNVVLLILAGYAYERRVGWERFVVVYTLALLAGSIASALAWSQELDSVGSSAAIWGVLGALVIVAWRSSDAGLRVRVFAGVGILAALEGSTVFLLGFAPQSFAVDYYAHAAGFCAGLVVESLLPPRSLRIPAVIAIALNALSLAIMLASTPREIRLLPRTTHTFDEVSLIFDAPSDLGAPEVTQEDGGFAYTFSNRDGSVFIEVLALPHATPITDAQARRVELVDWVDPDSMDEDIEPVADTTWPTVERAVVRSNDDTITLTWWQVGPLHHVVLTAHHPSRDKADALREILRTLRAE